MVAGPLVLARQLVDLAGGDSGLERIADQDVVDAQALVLAEGQVAIVPPAPALGRLFEEAEGIGQPKAEKLLELRAFLGGAMDLAGPGDRIVDVTVFGGDVEVSHQHQLLMRLQLRGEPAAQRVQPAHLVDELVAVRRLAVRKVAADDAHAAHGAGNHAGLLVHEARDVLDDGARRLTADQRHAVVGLLAEPLHLPARRAEVAGRELVIGQLGLLQHQGVDRMRGQPVEHLGQADGQGVDVPGGELLHQGSLVARVAAAL
mmetsp:Transcript_5519/g.13313  ORF Transcript_5519/g.13313 Transcript_5519/m.13313 type:complete len:260 (+) Transcript_5519:2398-3177(+)